MAENKALPGRPSRTAGYLPTLDGWRTISIVSVMLCHDRLHQAGPLSTGWFYLHGQLGVDVFFAISGLLICSRLLNEEQAKGRIGLRNFYVRRAFRILPPAAFFLATLLTTLRSLFTFRPSTRSIQATSGLLPLKNISI
jgi:peptidoglycan/LPS O-acetylase OafA/YrhL